MCLILAQLLHDVQDHTHASELGHRLCQFDIAIHMSTQKQFVVVVHELNMQYPSHVLHSTPQGPLL